jgi:predicted transcriptional regulator YheO
MGSSEVTFEDTQHQLDSMLSRLSGVKTQRNHLELERQTFLALNPASPMTVTQNDVVSISTTAVSLNTPLALIRAQEGIRLTSVALEDGAQFLNEHRARDNEGIPNRLGTQRFLRNQATRIETKALMGSSEITLENTQHQLDSMFCRVSDVDTLQKQRELERQTFLALNPASPMTVTQKDTTAVSLNTPLALIRAQEGIRLTSVALENGAQFLNEHRARDNEEIPNRLGTQRFLRNQATRIETKALMGSSDVTFEDTQHQLYSMLCRVSDMDTFQKQRELEHSTFLAFNPASPMTMTRKNEVARQILAYIRLTEFDDLESLQSLDLNFPIETPKPSEIIELAEEEAAEDSLIAAATEAEIDEIDEIDESLIGSNVIPTPSGYLYGLTNPISHTIQSDKQYQWELDLMKDAEEALAAATKTD